MSNLRSQYEEGDRNSTCRIRPPKGIRNDQLAYYNFYWMAYGNILFPFIFQYLNKLKTHIQKILAGCHFCLLTHLNKRKVIKAKYCHQRAWFSRLHWNLQQNVVLWTSASLLFSASFTKLIVVGMAEGRGWGGGFEGLSKAIILNH